MGHLWNRLLSRSVAPMLIADVGGILPPPPKSPCPSAPNHPTSTTMRSQDPNGQSKSLTGPGSGAGLPQRQRHTLGHHAPSKIRGAPNTGSGTSARACKGNAAQNPAQTQAHMHTTKTRRLVYSPPPSPELFRAGGGCTCACACTSCTPARSSFHTCFTYLYDISVGIHLN